MSGIVITNDKYNEHIMIIDKIENLEMYKASFPDVYEGLQCIKTMYPNIDFGIYPINERILVKVLEYSTGEECEVGYEAHKKHLDIHYVMRGNERIKWSPINEMDIKTPYDEESDGLYYEKPIKYVSEALLGDGIFAVMFPQDGHACTYYVDQCETIKKIVVKVKIE